jgi:hypothetical protein
MERMTARCNLLIFFPFGYERGERGSEALAEAMVFPYMLRVTSNGMRGKRIRIRQA